MSSGFVQIYWPNGKSTDVPVGTDWLQAAAHAGFAIPTGCLRGTCGSCEIDINGEPLRACISSVSAKDSMPINVEVPVDPCW
ncbi:MAG: 2Fe-2S iron-sulfur cluster binding domain-containing protein [bacterium]|nr:2Fe-2S iron-sulfur cluster binding domain-containing protein [bacterium]